MKTALLHVILNLPALSEANVIQDLSNRFRIKSGMTRFKNFKFQIILLLSVFCLLFFLPQTVFAQTQAVQNNNQYATPNVNPDVPKNLHTWTQNVMLEVMSALTCQIAGIDPTNPTQACLGIDQTTGKIGFVKNSGGAIGLMSGMIATLYTPPIHTGDYFSYLTQNFGITKPAYAQGTGFQSISPLINIWKAFRDIVYLLFVVVFIIVGLAIMLRIKIDPRTVMTIENQIPKIIIGLVMVTFSFAIAGFLIDLMYISIYFTYGILSSVNGANFGSAITNVQGQNPLQFANSLSSGGLGALTNNPSAATGEMVKNLFDGPIVRGVFGVMGAAIAWFVGVNNAQWMATVAAAIPVGGAITGTAVGIAIMATSAATGALMGGQLLGAIVNLVAFLVIGIAILSSLIKLWFSLIIAYIYILLDIVLAPFFIVFGLFPGSPIGFGGWLRDILANLAAFPATIGLFLIGKLFMDSFNSSNGTLFVPPLIGNPTGGSASPIGSLIGLGIILLAPQAVSMIKDLLKAPQFKYTAAIGQAIGVGTGAINVPGHVQKLGQLGYSTHYLHELPFGVGGFLARKLQRK